MMWHKFWLVLFILLGINNTVVAEELQSGDDLPVISLENQHGEIIQVAEDSEILLFFIEKAPSDIVHEFLMEQGEDFLTQHKAYVLADISAMPTMITRMFALPKMRERPYSMLLAYNSADLVFLPRQMDKITVMKLNAGKVTTVHYIDSATELAQMF